MAPSTYSCILGFALARACCCLASLARPLVVSSLAGSMELHFSWLALGISRATSCSWPLSNRMGITVKPTTAFLMLGAAQIIWGIRQLFWFSVLGTRPASVSPAVKSQALAALRAAIGSAPDPANGRLKVSITSQSFPFFVETTRHYTMWLVSDAATCVANRLNHSFQVEHKTYAGKQFVSNNPAVPLCVIGLSDSNGIVRKIAFSNDGLSALNKWLRAEAAPGQESEA